MDDTPGFIRERDNAEEEWKILRKQARAAMKETMYEKRVKAGLALREMRNKKLEGKRAKRKARAAEKLRLEAVVLATKWSDLKAMGNADMADQLKKFKMLGKTGFTCTQANRVAHVLQLQTLLLEADPKANDLDAGDSGIEGRAVKRRAAAGKGSRKRKKAGITSYCGFEWDDSDEFDVECIVGKVTTDGRTHYGNQVSQPPPLEPAASTVLTRVCTVAGQAEGGRHLVPHRVQGLPARLGVVRDRREPRLGADTGV